MPAWYWRIRAASTDVTRPSSFTSASSGLGKDLSKPAVNWRTNSASRLLVVPSPFASPSDGHEVAVGVGVLVGVRVGVRVGVDEGVGVGPSGSPRTKTSSAPLLSSGTRLEAKDSKAMVAPSLLMAGRPLEPLPLPPPGAW